ncbi:hypothetical protein NEPAR06_0142 [Nematocida parisii]|nr:hypothetical protein NEPAR06_0142 [Nematocida parisii]
MENSAPIVIERACGVTDALLGMSGASLNNIEAINNESTRETENNEYINELHQNTIVIEEDVNREAISQSIIKYLLLVYEGKCGLYCLFSSFALVFFSKTIIDIIFNLYSMNDHSDQTEHQSILLNLDRSIKIKMSLVAYIIYFVINLVYATFRFISCISPISNITAYGLIVNTRMHSLYYPLVCIIVVSLIIMSRFTISSTGENGGFIYGIKTYIGSQIAFLISEIIFICFKPFKYHLYRPTTKKVKSIILSVYYINHIMLLLSLLTLISYSTELVPLAVVNRAYWIKKAPNSITIDI